MIKILPWILFGLTSLASIYLFMLLLNGGVALDNARSEVTRLQERSNLALSIVRKNLLGKKSAILNDLSRELKQQGVIVGVEGDTFKVGDFIFETNNSLITEVHYID
ncbi:MAG: hypothetical protein AB9919_07870 [Geobacteraceae bacterium]